MYNEIEARASVNAIYSQFSVPGVKPEDIVLLFNTSNFQYYLRQVPHLQNGTCPFCSIDPNENEILPFENASWVVLRNNIAPRAGQALQLLLVYKKGHVLDTVDIPSEEMADQHRLYIEVRKRYGMVGCFDNTRDGDPFFNAKSVRHTHRNIHFSTGVDKVELTFGKKLAKIAEKLPKLRIWEKMRIRMGEYGILEPWTQLSPEEYELIKDDIQPPKTLDIALDAKASVTA